MVITKKDTVKVAVSTIVFPLVVALIAGLKYGAPYSSIFGLVVLGFMALIYRDKEVEKFEVFKVYALLPLFIFLISIGGWADQ